MNLKILNKKNLNKFKTNYFSRRKETDGEKANKMYEEAEKEKLRKKNC